MQQVVTRDPPMAKAEPKDANISIAEFWPVDRDGNERSINSLIEEFKGTEYQVSPSTLRSAKAGMLSRTLVKNLPILTALCSKWSGRKVSLEELIIYDD